MVELRRDWSEVIITMRREMERLLGDFTSRKPPSVRFSPRAWEPAIDVYETTDDIVVLVELPGLKQEEIEVVVHGNILIIRGERQDIKQGIRRTYYQMEILWGSFEKGITLPSVVDANQTKAYYEAGFLEIVLPKLREEIKQVKIKPV